MSAHATLPIALFLVVLGAVLGAFCHLYFALGRSKNPAGPPRLQDLGIPMTGAERHRLLQEDKSGEFLEKIKLAARQSLQKPSEFFLERWFRRAGIWDEEGRRGWTHGALVALVIFPVGFGIAGKISSLENALYGASGGLLLGLAVPLLVLYQRGKKRERELLADLPEIVRRLKAMLQLGSDLATTLRELVKSFGLAADRNTVILLFQQALAEASLGRDIGDALRDVAHLAEVRAFTDLCQTLALTEKRGAGWSAQLDGISAALVDHARLDAQRRPRGMRKH